MAGPTTGSVKSIGHLFEGVAPASSENISGAATVLVRNVSPWDYGMSIWTQRVSPQLAFLDPIPAPVPLRVCINLLQTAGWRGCSESSAALGPG